MSKIYEALLLAEKERLAGIQPPPAPAETAFAARTAVPIPRVARAVVAQHAPPAASRAVISAAVAVPTEPTFATRWTPQLDRLPALQERGSGVEQFRSLRSRLAAHRDLNILKSVLVSSGLPKEGKSFVAANLAISLARHKASRVLLIDGDMRRSSLHEMLGCPAGPGLSTYLAGHAKLSEVVQHMSEPSDPSLAGLESLSFIAAGKEGDKAGDLSGSLAFRELIQTLGAQYDWIVVDSSPVNLVTDGANMAHACDGVLLVARSGVTTLETAQRALGELKGSKVLGVVLNAVEKPPITGEYYGYDRLEAAPGSPAAL